MANWRILQRRVTAFNTAFTGDGVLLYIPKNVALERPIPVGKHPAW